jgi:hypothetical protein
MEKFTKDGWSACAQTACEVGRDCQKSEKHWARESAFLLWEKCRPNVPGPHSLQSRDYGSLALSDNKLDVTQCFAYNIDQFCNCNKTTPTARQCPESQTMQLRNIRTHISILIYASLWMRFLFMIVVFVFGVLLVTQKVLQSLKGVSCDLRYVLRQLYLEYTEA